MSQWASVNDAEQLFENGMKTSPDSCSALRWRSPAWAALQVDVTQGNAQPLAHRHSRFLSSGDQTGANIAGVVRADLERSGLFKPIDPKAYVDHITNINVVPNFANWRVINAQGLVTGQVALQPGRAAESRFPPVGRLWRKPDGGHVLLHPAGKLAARRPYGVGRDL